MSHCDIPGCLKRAQCVCTDGIERCPDHYKQWHARKTAEERRLPADTVDHPAHYGGADNPYEAIKVIEAWQLGFCLGNTIKYIARAGKKGDALEDLKKARWYLDHEIAMQEGSSNV